MSNAAKLHKRGRRTAVVAATATIATVLGPVGAYAWDVSPGANAGTKGVASIGIVDTSTATDNQGVKAVERGKGGQAIGDIRMVLPNGFNAGDYIDLKIANSGALSKAVTFDAAVAPTVAGPYKPELQVASDTDNVAAGVINTEKSSTMTTASFTVTTGKATPVAPKITATLRDSGSGYANDTLRLTIADRYATNSETDAKWMLTLSGLKVTAGADAAGEIVVGAVASDTGTKLDFGNSGAATGITTTVPGYIAPAYLDLENGSVVADGTPQLIGKVSIKETDPATLTNSAYTIGLTGAAYVTSVTPTVKVIDQATGTAVADTERKGVVSVGANSVSVTLSGSAVATKRYTVEIDGLMAQASTPADMLYTLAGLNIKVAADTLGTAGSVNQGDLLAPTGSFQEATSAVSPQSRLGGTDRYATNLKIVNENFPNYTEADHLIIANGANFPDALSAGYLAAALGGKPLMLTPSSYLTDSIKDKIRNLGIKKVWIIGGTGAISQGVEDTLKGMQAYKIETTATDPGPPPVTTSSPVAVADTKLAVTRLSGADRFATNKAVNSAAEAIKGSIGVTTPVYGQSGKRTALFANGMNFPDALAATPLTMGQQGQQPIPVVLTSSSLQADAKAQVEGLQIQRAILVGGTGVISDAQESALSGMGLNVKRVAGTDRYATAKAVNDFALAKVPDSTTATDNGLGWTTGINSTPYLVSGTNFPDALTAGVNGLSKKKFLALTATGSLSSSTQTWLESHKDLFSYMVAVGGSSVVSDATLKAANAAVAGG